MALGWRRRVRLAFAARDLAIRPALGLIALEGLGDQSEFPLLLRALGEALDGIARRTISECIALRNWKLHPVPQE